MRWLGRGSEIYSTSSDYILCCFGGGNNRFNHSTGDGGETSTESLSNAGINSTTDLISRSLGGGINYTPISGTVGRTPLRLVRAKYYRQSYAFQPDGSREIIPKITGRDLKVPICGGVMTWRRNISSRRRNTPDWQCH